MAMIQYRISRCVWVAFSNFKKSVRLFSLSVNGGEATSKSTIFSLCSGYGKSGVAVFRISGSSSLNVLKSMTKWKDHNTLEKQMFLKRIFHPFTKEQIDRGLVLWFPGPNSLTGEDVCELHVHGGPAIINKVFSALSSLSNFRQALPGEFIKRSFENGKVDLTQVEGLSDLINAESEMQRKQALKLYEGETRNLYSTWTDKLVKGMAHIEAYIDFGEEEHMEENIFKEVCSNMAELCDEIRSHLRNDGLYEKIKEGVRVCIVGEPNVGKSSLLNSLCKRPAAIISPHAGTTRDVIEVSLNLCGLPVVVSDTAGLRSDVSDEVEKIGIERAYNQSESSHVLILVVDVTNPEIHKLCSSGTIDVSSLEHFAHEHLKKLGLEIDQSTKKLVLVFNKVDLASPQVMQTLNSFLTTNEFGKQQTSKQTSFTRSLRSSISFESEDHELLHQHFATEAHSSSQLLNSCSSVQPKLFSCCLSSCLSKDGLLHLEASLKELVKDLLNTSDAGNYHSINARHHQHLEKVCINLKDFVDILLRPHGNEDVDTRLELSAEKLRAALYQIGHITGRITTDNILSRIFKDFCIGK